MTYRCEWDIRRSGDDPIAAIDDFLRIREQIT
jgi:hypothetical protein